MAGATHSHDLPDGVCYWPGCLDRVAQEELVEIVREGVKQAPLFTPRMPKTGREMSVRMTNFGQLGWVTDKQHGYRYQANHPVTGDPWPPIPSVLLTLWQELADYPFSPQACLVNFYGDNAKMGLHQDRDEQDFSAPVLSISLGNDCLFRIGGTERGGKTRSFLLHSGDVMMLSGSSRLAYHGVDKVYSETSDLLKSGGRVNLTLRRVGDLPSPPR